MIDRVELETYLTKVTQCFGVEEAHAMLMRFLCRCLMLVQQFLPGVGRNALDAAKAFWLDGTGRGEGLLAARVECWNFLDAKGSSTDIRDREDAAMRAVICVLYAVPESEDFSAETVRWFAAMFDRLGNYSIETKRLMDSDAAKGAPTNACS